MTGPAPITQALPPCPYCGGGETRIDEQRLAPRMSGPGALISVTIRHWCNTTLRDGKPGYPDGVLQSYREVRARDTDSAYREYGRRTPQAIDPAALVKHWSDRATEMSHYGIKGFLDIPEAELLALKKADVINYIPGSTGEGCTVPMLRGVVLRVRPVARNNVANPSELCASECTRDGLCGVDHKTCNGYRRPGL